MRGREEREGEKEGKQEREGEKRGEERNQMNKYGRDGVKYIISEVYSITNERHYFVLSVTSKLMTSIHGI